MTMRPGSIIKKLSVVLTTVVAFILWVEAGVVMAGKAYSVTQQQSDQHNSTILPGYPGSEAALFETMGGGATGSCPVRLLERNAPGGSASLQVYRPTTVAAPMRIFTGTYKYQPVPLSVPWRSADYYVLTLRRLII